MSLKFPTLIFSRKLKMNNDKNHSFHNPALSPDEELSRRGYSMYMGQDTQSDVESGRVERHPERHQERYVFLGSYHTER